MKRLLALSALAVFAAATAFAGVQDFGIFKADIPAGWTAEQDGSTVGIVKDDSTASMSVTVEDNDGTSIDDLAAMFVKELKGDNLTKDSEGNAVFEFTNVNGVRSRAVLNCDTKHFGLIVITGMENAQAEILAIIDSLKFRDI